MIAHYLNVERKLLCVLFRKKKLIKMSSYVDIIFGWKLTIIWVLA